MDLTISIVSWNVKDLLEECLNSIFENTKDISFEVFVADNNSKDGTPDMVKQKFPQVKLIKNNENLGFTKANNQIIKQASGKYVILLNPDTVVLPGALSTLVKFMEDRPEAGAVGPMLEYEDGSFQPSCRAFPSIETEFYRALFFDQLIPKSKLFGKYMMSYWPHNDIREVDQPMGAALMVRKKTIDEVGLMDENIVILYDEVDWCKRIKDKGWKIFFTPESKIVHYKSQSFKQLKSPLKAIKASKTWRKSRHYYFKKHHGALSAWLVELFDLLHISIALGILYMLGKGLLSLWNF